jgi:hypothetical protein
MARRRIGQRIAPLEPADPEFEKYAGFGSEEVRTDDIAWLGDDLDYDREPYLKQLDSEDILLHILLYVVDTYPSKLKSTSKGRSSRDDRAEKALEFLTGRRREKGRPTKNMQAILLDAARKYFETRFHTPDEKYLDTIIWEVLVEHGTDPDLDEDARSNAIRLIRVAFKKDKDRLITQITSDGKDALSVRDAKVRYAVAVLREIGALGNSGSEG